MRTRTIWNAFEGITHRDNGIDDNKDNTRDSGHDGGNDTANSRDDRTLRQLLVNGFQRIKRLTIVDGGCGLVERNGKVEWSLKSAHPAFYTFLGRASQRSSIVMGVERNDSSDVKGDGDREQIKRHTTMDPEGRFP